MTEILDRDSSLAQRFLPESVDRLIFVGSVLVIIGLCAPLAAYPTEAKTLLANVFDELTHNFGVLYLMGSFAALLFLLGLAASRFGDIKLGNVEPDFPTFSWSAMLFCGGIGTSILYWGTIEWTHYLQSPPFDVEPGTAEALSWSTSYPIFHWGPIGWALYCLPGVAMSYSYHVRGASLRLSEACRPILGKLTDGPLGRTIDLCFVIGLVGACSTGFGLAIPLISPGISEILSLDQAALGFALEFMVIIFVTAIFSMSVWFGLERGIKRLSDLNVSLAIVLLLFIFVVGPTLFIVELGFESAGHMLQNFILMSTWTDSAQTSSFVEGWTVFYWAWWLALGPYMGIFIAKISRGRTIRQVVLGCIGYGTLGSAAFFAILGNYAVYLEFNDLLPVVDILEAGGGDAAIISVLGTLPISGIVIFLFTIVCVIFAATSYDSASYTIAACATKDLGREEHPARWHRVFWACLLGVLPITLIYVGGLDSLKSAVTVSSVPLFVIVLLVTLSLCKSLAAHQQTDL